MKTLSRLLSTLALLALAACGTGEDPGTPPFGSGSGSGSGTGGTVAPSVTLEMRLVDQAGAATSNVLAGQPARALATLKRNGSVVSGEIVQFSVDQPIELVKIDPTAGSLLTDANGQAIVTVSSLGTSSGAGRILATATVSGVAATSAANFFATSGSTSTPSTLTLSGLEIGSTSVSAYGTTGLRVRVLQNAVPYTSGPVTVNFTTSCPAGRSTITASASTQPDGYAVATFADNGCAQTADTTVTITASIATDSKSGSVTVRSPSTGSLRFVSVVPSDKSITLRGQGGNGRQENATVTFQLVDVAGQGVGDANVCFDISTYLGGLNIDGFGPANLPSPAGSAALCGTDALSVVRYVKRTNPDGTIAIQVNSGTVPTPVRVRARALYPATTTAALESFSDTLSVSTGLPMQRSFSLSVDKANIDGGDFDGEEATLTARLADQFSNPVPDGTVVNFIGSGAAVCTANNGSCRTTNGACSCKVTSQARRPADNRIVITAYAVGLEDFDDANGDNLFTPSPVDAFLDTDSPARARGYDLGDAYVDSNKDGIAGDGSPSAAVNPTINGDTDILIPYQQPNVFTRNGDGIRGTAHIRRSAVIYLSRSSSLGAPTAVVPKADLQQELDLLNQTSTGSFFVRLQPSCPQGTPVPQSAISFYLDDGIGNPMASGTGIAVIDPSANVSTGGARPSTVLAIGARGPLASIDYPNVPKALTWTSTDLNKNVPSAHGLTVRGVEDKCVGDATFALQVSSPRGGPATAEVLTEGDPRGSGSRLVNVKYRNSGMTVTTVTTARVVDVTQIRIVGPAGQTAAGQVTIDWGDGTANTSFPAGSPSSNPISHTYASAGQRTVTVTATVGGVSYTGRVAVSIL